MTDIYHNIFRGDGVKNRALFKEGIPTLIIVFFFTILLYVIHPMLSFLVIGLILFVIYFFRDPNRNIPTEASIIISPADGLITDISEVEENSYFKHKTISISIFMSPLDVHINRSPIAGEVDFISYQKGKFKPAKNLENHQQNEKNFIGIKNNNIQVLVVQIAGIMARRIVNWSSLGQSLEKGEKIGMIKFSSGTKIYLPIDTEVLVKKGDRVLSGKTIIGRY